MVSHPTQNPTRVMHHVHGVIGNGGPIIVAHAVELTQHGIDFAVDIFLACYMEIIAGCPAMNVNWS